MTAHTLLTALLGPFFRLVSICRELSLGPLSRIGMVRHAPQTGGYDGRATIGVHTANVFSWQPGANIVQIPNNVA